MALEKKGAPQMNWRVGQTGISQAGAARVADEFRVDIGQIGRLTPEDVRAHSQLEKDLKQQVILARQYQKSSNSIFTHKTNIEEIRGDVLAKGLSSCKAVDNLASRAQLQTGQYMQDLQTIAHNTNLGLNTISQSGQMTRDYATTHYELKGQQARQLQASKLQQLGTNMGKETNQKIEDAKYRALAQAREKEEAIALGRYIRADDYTPQGSRAPSFMSKVLRLVA